MHNNSMYMKVCPQVDTCYACVDLETLHISERCCLVCGSACSCNQERLLLLWQRLQKSGAAGGKHAVSSAGGSELTPP